MKQLHFLLGVLQEGLHQQNAGEDEQKRMLGCCIFSKLGHLWRKVMPALKSSVINFWRGLFDTAFCDSRDWTHRPRKALCALLVLKCFFPGTAYQHQLSLEWPLGQVMLTGASSILWGPTWVSCCWQSSLCSAEQSPQGHPAGGRLAQLNGTTIYGLQSSGWALHTKQTPWNIPQAGADP